MIDGGVFVVASREPATLFEVAEAALDDVPVAVVDRVESDRAVTGQAALSAVPFPVVGLGDEDFDSAVAEVATDCLERVGFVGPRRI